MSRIPFPSIRRGQGRLTPARWDRIGNAVNLVEQWGHLFPELTRPQKRVERPALPWTDILIRNVFEEVSPNIWTYSWDKAIVFSTMVWTVKLDGISSDTEGYSIAMNLAEVGNTYNQGAHGVTLGDFNLGVVTLLPIPDNTVARLFTIPSIDDNQPTYWFDIVNAIDVDCQP